MTLSYRKFLGVSTPIAASVWLLSGCGAPLEGATGSSGEVSPEIHFVNKGAVTGFGDEQAQAVPHSKKTSLKDYSKYYHEEDVVFDIEPTIQKGKIFMRKTQAAAPPREVVTETARLKQEVGALKTQFAVTQDAYVRDRVAAQDAYARERAKTVSTFNDKVESLSKAHERERQALVADISGLKSSLRQVEASKQVLKQEIVTLSKQQQLDKKIAEERRKAAKDARAESFMEELEIRKKLDDIRRHELLQTAEMQKRSALDNERRLTMLESERKGLVAKISGLEGELTQFAREEDVLQTSKSFEAVVANLSKQLDYLGADAVRRSEFALSDTWTRDALNRLSGTLGGLQDVAARKDDIQMQNRAVESRLLAMQNHIEGVKAFADQNRSLTQEQRKVIGRVAALSEGIDAIQYQLDSQNSISAAAQASLQNQLASLNNEFTELRKISASKGDVGATRALLESRASHLSDSIAMLQSQVQSGQDLDMRAQNQLDQKVHEVGIEITALNAAVDYMKDGLDDGLGQTRSLRDSIQNQLASLNSEFTALRKVSATKSDVHMTKELFDVRSAYLEQNIERLRDLLQSGQVQDQNARELMSQSVQGLGKEVMALNAAVDYMKDGLDDGLGQTRSLRDSIQNQLASLNSEFTALRKVSATKSDVHMTKELFDVRSAYLEQNIERLRDLLQSGQVQDQNARELMSQSVQGLGKEVMALNAAVDYMKDGLDDGLGQTRSLRDAVQNQLASLNSEFTQLRKEAASKDALDATNTLVTETSRGLVRSLAQMQEQMASDRLHDADTRNALNRELSKVGTDILALRTHFDNMQGQGNVRFNNYIQSQGNLQEKLDSFVAELSSLRAAAAQKSDVESAKNLVEERLASLQADVNTVKGGMVSKGDLDTLKADLEEKIFSMRNAAGMARNSGDFIEEHARFDAVQNGEHIDAQNLKVAILQPPSVNGDTVSDVHMTSLPQGYIAETPIENWIDLQDYQVVVHAENESLEDILGDIVHSASPFAGQWKLQWKLKSEHQDILDEKFSLNAETTFSDFANYVSSYVFSYRGFKLSFNLFDKERIILVTDSE